MEPTRLPALPDLPDRRHPAPRPKRRPASYFFAVATFYAVVFASAIWTLAHRSPSRPLSKPGALLDVDYIVPPIGRMAPRMPWEPRIAAIASVLRERTRGDSATSERVAEAIVKHADRTRLSPSLLAGVVLVENTTLKPTARNRRTGATGLMQVMPYHAGRAACRSRDLTDIDSNICHGTHLLADIINEHGQDVDRALLAYNGCVGGRDAACRRYPDRVFEGAARVRREIQRLAQTGPSLAFLNSAVRGTLTPRKSGTIQQANAE